MKLMRCRICGDTYLGSETPSHCPFCGAHNTHIVESRDYPLDINEVDLADEERADLESGVELETSNTRFYLAASGQGGNDHLRSYFKRLAKVEAEHCSLFCKLLKRDKPADLMEPSASTGSWLSDIEDSLARENRATTLYAAFAERAADPRVREVFKAISEVEADHIALDELAKTYV